MSERHTFSIVMDEHRCKMCGRWYLVESATPHRCPYTHCGDLPPPPPKPKDKK